MNARFFLYDANGTDEEVEPDGIDIEKLKESQLLWVNILDRDAQTLLHVAQGINLKNLPAETLSRTASRPQIENFKDFFRFNIVSVKSDTNQRPQKVPIDFIVGKNFIIAAHEGEVGYFTELRKREKAETMFGALDAESFLTTLLDLHIVSYFQALEVIERRVDEFDAKVLEAEMVPADFLSKMVELRADVSSLRRWLLPHRDIFYSLTRADFLLIADSDSLAHYKMLTQHFESAVDSVESSRETVLSIFDLYATKSAQETNSLIRKLTFFTLIVGSLGVVAGVFGMNYQLSYFETEQGFWFTVAGMVLIAITWATVAKIKRWI